MKTLSATIFELLLSRQTEFYIPVHIGDFVVSQPFLVLSSGDFLSLMGLLEASLSLRRTSTHVSCQARNLSAVKDTIGVIL